jgi:hypothetical protein
MGSDNNDHRRRDGHTTSKTDKVKPSQNGYQEAIRDVATIYVGASDKVGQRWII